MDATYRIRPFHDGDFTADARIATLLFPDQPTSEEECRTWDRTVRASGMFKEALVAEETSSGKVVATSAVNHMPWTYDPDWYWISVSVDPDHQHRGIGSELYRRVERTALHRNAKGLWATVLEAQPRSVAFLRQAGFSEKRRGWLSQLDLTQPPTEYQRGVSDPAVYQDLQFTTLAEDDPGRPETVERFYRIDRDAGRDAPRMGPASSATLEQFRAIMLDPAQCLPEGTFFARVGDEYVAMTVLARLPAEPDVLTTPFTGTRKDYRGRGIATELKRRAIAFARSRGYRCIRTHNDTANLPMWSINQRLGFEKRHTVIYGEKTLPPLG